MAKIVVVFGSTTGNTEEAATKIQELLDGADLKAVSSLSPADLEDYDVVIMGSSTWGLGDLQDDWEAALPQLSAVDMTGKKMAFFGTGDQSSFSDSFSDAMGTIYEAFKNSGATLIGSWPTDGYDYSESKAVMDGSFVGLPLDFNNQPELTDERISEWVAMIKENIE
jgi:flavodoxin I